MKEKRLYILIEMYSVRISILKHRDLFVELSGMILMILLTGTANGSTINTRRELGLIKPLCLLIIMLAALIV